MEAKKNMQGIQKMSYRKFWIMMLISFFIMYAIMFMNVEDASHIYLSVTRTYMALLMVTAMAPVMMGMMGMMYQNKKLNNFIIIGSIGAFVGIMLLLRNQAFVGERQYMKGMIPHHSSAILTSKHAKIKDPEVKKLSEEIIKAQEKEIAEMKAKLAELDR